MKFMKKISAVLLSLCLVVPCFSLVAQAADGKISFTDPETKVGDMVEVKCVTRSNGGSIGDMEIQLTYDSAYLRFQSGDGVEAADGTLTYKGSGNSSEASFTVEFQALQEGETKITVSSYNISSSGGAALSLTEGNSTVKIGEGDPSKIKEESGGASSTAGDKTIEVNGASYTLTDEFADADIPSGYSRTTVSLDGEDRQMVVNEAGSVTLGYLKNGEGLGEFFLYNTEDATFAPYEEISISDTTSIIVLSDTSKVKLPKNYQEAKLTLNEKEFPVWQDSTSDRFYVIYAMNNQGETGYYQYDTVEGTYQNLDNPQEKAAEEKKDTSSLMGKIRNLLEKHLSLVILVVGLGSIIVLILIIVLAVKLRHRNDELDELYEEYGIDDEEEEEELPVAKEKKKSGLFGKRSKKDDFEDFDDYEDDDYEDDDDYDDDDDDYVDESKFSTVDLSDVPVEDDVFSGYSERDELTIDDLEDLLGEKPKKKRSQQEDNDAFKVDFIDLD